jgi:hypothetical protein
MEKKKAIDVLCYSTGEPGKRLQRMIRDLVPRERLEIYRTFSSFSDRLRKPMDDTPVAVILASSEDDLLTILSIGNLLYDVRFILILPDREDPTVAIGHSLRPRFLSYADSDFREVTAVLGKMIDGSSCEQEAKERTVRHVYPVGSMTVHRPDFKKLLS